MRRKGGTRIAIKDTESELGEENVERKSEMKNLSFTFFSLLLPLLPTLSSSFSLSVRSSRLETSPTPDCYPSHSHISVASRRHHQYYHPLPLLLR